MKTHRSLFTALFVTAALCGSVFAEDDARALLARLKEVAK